MHRIDFVEPLTALEIRDPSIEVCEAVAQQLGVYANFHQHQQKAFSGGYPGGPKSGRTRVGNGKHKTWFIDFQTDQPQISRPNVIGRMHLLGPSAPENMQFGGFDYGVGEDKKPKYSYITIKTPSEAGVDWRPLDPSREILDLAYAALNRRFVDNNPRLFDVATLTLG